VWEVDVDSLEDLAIGAGILGTGGGGNPYYGMLHAKRLIEEGATVAVIPPDEVPDNARVVSVGSMGAPTVSFERIYRGDEPLVALRTLETYVGASATHLIPGEIGGANSMRPLVVAAQTGLPVVDGDGMGRAFPEIQMDTFSIYGVPIAPAAIADPRHNTVIFSRVDDAFSLERYARAVTIQMGGSVGYAFPMMTGSDMKRTLVPHTVTLAAAIGRAVRAARRNHDDPVSAVLAAGSGVILFDGKVVDVERRNVGGFARGRIVFEGYQAYRGSTLEIDFQNEYLIALVDGEVVAVVPDLICLVGADTAEPVTTELVRYGLRVVVIGMPAHERLKTAEALAVIGPAAFGYPDVAYAPMPGQYGINMSGLRSQ
jgi:uncharacterized protein